MTMRNLPWALLGLLMLAPAALAYAEPGSCPDNTDAAEPCPDPAADDCPPDAVCIASEEGGASGNQTADGPTYGDCGAEVCAYDESHQFGPGDCIDCTGVVDGPTTCAEAAGTTDAECHDGELYLDGRGPADGSCENCRDLGTQSAGSGPSALALGMDAIAVAAAAVAVAAAVVVTRRK